MRTVRTAHILANPILGKKNDERTQCLLWRSAAVTRPEAEEPPQGKTRRAVGEARSRERGPEAEPLLAGQRAG